MMDTNDDKAHQIATEPGVTGGAAHPCVSITPRNVKLSDTVLIGPLTYWGYLGEKRDETRRAVAQRGPGGTRADFKAASAALASGQPLEKAHTPLGERRRDPIAGLESVFVAPASGIGPLPGIFPGRALITSKAA